jgi:hypothetical protein
MRSIGQPATSLESSPHIWLSWLDNAAWRLCVLRFARDGVAPSGAPAGG